MVVFHKSCGVVLFRTVENVRMYLILQYPQGHWDFVKGHVEVDDQHEIATSIRELKEETGISNVSVISGYRNIVEYSYREKGELHNKVVYFYLAETHEERVVISHEHRDFIWLPIEGALNKVTFDNARDLLVSAEAFLRTL